MEIIESFIIDNEIQQYPFYVELAGITLPDSKYEIKREHSDVYVLEYVIEGSGIVEIDGKTFFPSEGDVYFLPKGSRHHYYSSKETPFKKIWMNVNGSLCDSLIQCYGLCEKYLFEKIDLSDLFEHFLNICRQRELNTKDLFDKCSIVFLEIIQKLSRYGEETKVYNRYAAKAKNYCDINIYKKLTAEDVAQYINISVSQLNRIFKKEFGITVYAYILNNKINTAKSLLNGTAMTISEIAFLLNFTDEHYFSNIFKTKTNMTPTQFRSRQKPAQMSESCHT